MGKNKNHKWLNDNCIYDKKAKNKTNISILKDHNYAKMESLNLTFQKQLIENCFKNYLNKSQSQLINELGVQVNGNVPKNVNNLIIKKIINQIPDFQKEHFVIKSIRTQSNNLKESLSFNQINYCEILNENWEDTALYKTLNKEFLFAVFTMDPNNKDAFLLSKVLFWKMNSYDLEFVYRFWEHTKETIKKGEYDNFITLKNDFICHVRTKGKNNQDVLITPQNTFQPKRSFWLNAKYIYNQLF